eukprot:CAMPEP_0119280280 /NCGR_PEP_ID=MMETSP1329-20130426/22349_1 /TAXON_ID=114041 /ORGANISM="Genus nov. species nov., Strain RCC1024" /LENGTH=249 /DNA_ID=CAMNT_0007280863 /DNA_START=108 /DNA_END=853 /DNA_ORIENTATION=-
MRSVVALAMAALAAADLSKLPPPGQGVTRLFLCRHGQTDWNAAGKIQGSVDRELTPLGEAQAREIGRALEDVPISLVASSPLKRASRTADAVHRLQPHATRLVHEGLREMDFGDFEGTPPHSEGYDEVNAAWAAGDVGRAWPNGESPRDVEVRARAALAELGLLGLAPGGRPPRAYACIVCHGRFNKILLASLLGRGVRRCGEIQQGNCCINVIDVRAGAHVDDLEVATDVVLDYREHLEKLGDADSPA